MERLTLREAAQRTSRSITTLRRYIRSGRLRAEKRFGRFGPEYFLSPQDLASAGFDLDGDSERAPVAPAPAETLPVPTAANTAIEAPVAATGVPMALYQELQMKHEQLLVQYGMVRAAGMRAIELQQKLDEQEQEISRLKSESERGNRAQTLQAETSDQALRQAHLELEGRALEIAALKEKVRGLEMLTRNAVTNETIEHQFANVMNQSRRVERLGSRPTWRVQSPRGRDNEPEI